MSYLARIPVAGIFLVLILSNASGAGNAEPSPEADFRMSCSSCHGEDGRGGGGKAFGLSAEPPDLTTLSRRNGGVFPRERLRRIIDGREDIKVHGDREMPVWGQLFKLDAEEGLGGAEGDEAAIEQRIEALIDFIESLQN
ncbi:c-type cytochrome [Taklimakanibacter deserti]|uniref:c-type cytochrome n=1 Tax=Taklimakanibacter deserti TaxID=2267839 RepID=UPI0013C45FEE